MQDRVFAFWVTLVSVLAGVWLAAGLWWVWTLGF
jgi:hypothetical protein